MAEFTKGEWQTVFFKGMNEQEMYVKVSGGACICKILDRPSAEKEANARLIAAAPDYQTFAKNFFEWHANHFEDFDDEINGQLLCLANEAEAAIAKAEKGK